MVVSHTTANCHQSVHRYVFEIMEQKRRETITRKDNRASLSFCCIISMMFWLFCGSTISLFNVRADSIFLELYCSASLRNDNMDLLDHDQKSDKYHVKPLVKITRFLLDGCLACLRSLQPNRCRNRSKTRPVHRWR